MISIFIAAITCILLSLLPCSWLSISDITLNILYGVIGVLFSVGMSLIISFNSSNLNNPIHKKSIRDSIHDVRNSFLCIFSVSTFFFVAYSLMDDNCQTHVWINKENIMLTSTWPLSVLLFLIYSVIALIKSYVELQKLFEDIEDKMQKEKKK